MVNKEGIREYFSRLLLGHLKVVAVPLKQRGVKTVSLKRKIEVFGNPMRPRVVSSSRLAVGKIGCKSGVINIKNFKASVRGGKVAKYAPGEMKVKKFSLKFALKLRKWKKEFAALPHERRNRLKFVPENMRDYRKGEIELAYFAPIIEKNVARLILNKHDGTLFVWYNPDARGSSPRGLYLCKRMGEKDVDWRWV